MVRLRDNYLDAMLDLPRYRVNVIAIIQARTASTRLPNKVLIEVAGKPLIVHEIERVKRAETLDGVVLAVPTSAENEPLIEIAEDLGINWWAGSETDVLRRVLEAAHRFEADVIVELTGDCPLIDPVVIDRVVYEYLEWFELPGLPEMDFVTNAVRYTYPRGMDVRVFPTKVLERVNALTNDPVDREHVSLYIWEHPADFDIRFVDAPPEHRSNARLTVDVPEDLELVREIFKCLHPVNPEFGLTEILALLDARPDLRDVNAHITQKPVRVRR